MKPPMNADERRWKRFNPSALLPFLSAFICGKFGFVIEMGFRIPNRL
jgi:hypothetical protein